VVVVSCKFFAKHRVDAASLRRKLAQVPLSP